MGRVIDHNRPYTEEDKQYLRDRGRPYLIPANERRFGEDGTRQPEDHELADSHAVSPFYNVEERAAAVYDVGGAPLPGTVLNKDTGRVFDRDNGVEVEFTGPGHTASGYDVRYDADGIFTEKTLDENGNEVDDQFDDDIVGYVTELEVGELKEELKANNQTFAPNTGREKLMDKLIIFYQDLRNSGVTVSFADDEDETPAEATS